MNNKDGKRGEFMTSSRQSSRARTPDFLKLAGRNMRRSRGAGKAAAEEALALLVSGAVKSQTAAAAAVGVSQGQLSSVKTQLKPYMQLVRIPQMQNACVCLLTLRTLGFGGAPLGACGLCMALTHVICVMRMLCLRRTGNSRPAARLPRLPQRWFESSRSKGA